MKIRSVTIENYRQYRELSLDLSNERSDVALIVGSNGTGKTNLLNAIIWCLYGREDYYGRDMESSPLVNQKTVDDGADGDLLTVSVSLDISFQSGAEAQISRRQDFYKSGKATTVGPIDLRVVELRDPARGFVSVNNPEHWIERWVPSRLEPYFLFDGERLDKFFLHAEAKKVQDAVLQIAQIDLLGRLIVHLDTAAGELYSRASKQLSGTQSEELSQKLDDQKERLEKTSEEIVERNALVTRCEDAVRKLEAKIGNIAEVKADIKHRQELDAQAKKISESLDESWGQLEQWAVRSAPSIMSYAALTGLQEVISSARTERRLPPPVSPQILRDLLDKRTCVCGNSLAEGSAGCKSIEELLAEYSKVNELGEAFLSVEGGLRAATARVGSARELAAAHLNRIDDWERRQQGVDEELTLITARLAGHEDEQVQQTDAQLTLAKEALRQANLELAKREIATEDLGRDIERIEREIERLASKEQKSEKLMSEAQFARECSKVAKSMHRQLTDEVRQKVSDTLQKQFLQMTWKRDGISSVSIDEGYRVSVRNKRGFEILPDLSAGERECLALAFSLALSEVSGYELPMVIDTPMGRLNPDVQSFMAEVLRDATRDGDHSHQLVMLMTEAEYNHDVAAILGTRAPRVFKLDFDAADSVSTLKEVV